MSPAPPPARAYVWRTGDVGFKKHWPRALGLLWLLVLSCGSAGWEEELIDHQANCCLQYLTLVL